ncbi:non-homologous end-joining DNA ligase [Achromobacter animicus]|nr:non-homologous end-joining DNA ligase [Achromobacter animicus]MDH0683080.1 non-homologous end-joining DNA ligase [Achromobacter animicus]
MPRHGEDWLYEVKFDGYRMLARVEGSRVQMFTRNGHDWSSKVPHLVTSIQQLNIPSAWIDGEIVVLADNGVPSFQALQNAFDGKRTSNIIFYAFDLPFVAGRDIRGEPLHLRRELLSQLLATRQDDHIRFSEAFCAAPSDLIASACRMGLEGIMAKRQSARYVSSRTDDWVKIKCAQRQEFVIVGYTAPKGGARWLWRAIAGRT